MVYCTKCGTKNEDDVKACVNCRAPLFPERSIKERNREERPRGECFGLPNSGAIAGLVFGVLIILFGITSLLGWEIN